MAPAAPASDLPAPSLSRRLVASVVAAAILVTVGGSGVPLASAGAHNLQALADALKARWAKMVAEGVPADDVAPLERQWSGATETRVFGVGSAFWLPGARSLLDRWQAQTDAIWNRNLATDRAAATIAEGQLHEALGSEPAATRKERLDALAAASTPAELLALRADWDLETRLMPADLRIADAVGKVSALMGRASAMGITSDPAGAMLLDARNYSLQNNLGRMAHAEQLVRGLAQVQVDLSGRLAAASSAQKGFDRLAGDISLAIAYGMGVGAPQARLDANRKLYATAASISQFNTIINDLSTTASGLERSINALRSRMHIVSGVAFYYQSHALSCEETATSMALTHQGIYLSQDQILAEMGADRRPQYYDSRGILRWGNPYLSFVGYVDGVENKTGLQANYPPLVRVAWRHGARVIAYGSMSAEYVYARITAGHPVVVYATYDWGWHPRNDYLSFDGRWIPYIGPALSHVYTAVGVRPDAVLVNDPIRGQYWVSKRAFEAAYGVFNEAIVFA